MINILRLQVDAVKQVWLADDAAGAGGLHGLLDWLNILIIEGQKYGYYVNSGKLWLILKNDENLRKAQEIFKDLKRHIGAAVGLHALKEAYFNEKVQIWCSDLNALCKIAQIQQPHAQYAGYIHGFKHKFNYFLRTIPNTSALLQPIEDIITHQFLPNLFGSEISADDHCLFLPTYSSGGFRY